MRYDKAGRLTELKHEDTAGILDRYRYEYDAAGNKAAIHKERRGLPEESGSYRYTYDGLQRLTGVEKDGGLLRRCFGVAKEFHTNLTQTFGLEEIYNMLIWSKE